MALTSLLAIWQLSVLMQPLAEAAAGQLTLIYGMKLSCLPLTCSLAPLVIG